MATGCTVSKDGPAGEVTYRVAVDVRPRTTPNLKAAVAHGLKRLDDVNRAFGEWYHGVEDAKGTACYELPADDPDRRRYDRIDHFLTKAVTMGEMIEVVLAIPDDADLNPSHSRPWVQAEKFLRAVEELALGVGLADPAVLD
jgi:hypothetical protein